ncbi:MAG: hypothetical protein HRT44_06250 [Bdellovibrionales bacterium]|nr:hypothetical protein [Bdellovibrionales bacterium]NQZ18843.1 hypothetical protein [Bdellovibrionales bacterium]
MNIALLTCSNLDEFVNEEHHLEKALKDKGWDYDWIVWTESAPDWSFYDAVVIRTTWDYIQHKPKFLEYLKSIEDSGAKLFNGSDIVNWNSDKKYLKELEGKGVRIVPTRWGVDFSLDEFNELYQVFENNKMVIKPNVGAGAFKTFLIDQGDNSKIEEALSELKGIEVMIQPYLTGVASEGEFSMHYFSGVHSHTILKTPKDGDFRSQEEFGSYVRRIDPEESLFEFADQVLKEINEKLLYARVDIVRENGKFHLIELELIEPCLYFRTHEPSAGTFVQALESFLN